MVCPGPTRGTALEGGVCLVVRVCRRRSPGGRRRVSSSAHGPGDLPEDVPLEGHWVGPVLVHLNRKRSAARFQLLSN